jgi:hypothetical protein
MRNFLVAMIPLRSEGKNGKEIMGPSGAARHMTKELGLGRNSGAAAGEQGHGVRAKSAGQSLNPVRIWDGDR